MLVNNFYKNINGLSQTPGGPLNNNVKKQEVQKGSFEEILKGKIDSQIKYSKHAELRLRDRNISLTDIQKEKICQAVKRAEDKGVKESLVMVDNVALVVNIKNKTVITALSSNELKENVFTNIDGAVFA